MRIKRQQERAKKESAFVKKHTAKKEREIAELKEQKALLDAFVLKLRMICFPCVQESEIINKDAAIEAVEEEVIWEEEGEWID